MSASTRERIMRVARTLFSERGYNAVAVSDIAQEAGISKGNLTYHFKRKEDIVVALLEEAAAQACPPKPACTLDQLDEVFRDMERIVAQHAYYFWHYAQLAQVSDRIASNQESNAALMLDILRQSLANLESTGALKPEPFPGVYDGLAEQLLMASVYWMPFCDLRGIERTEFRDHAWSILRPSLA